jgi:polar amino acid transport system permease protein
VPLLVVLYVLYYALPVYRVPLNAFTAGVLGLSINSTAFTIEIFRGGFAAIAPGQYDAARSLGFKPAHCLALVIVPQVFRVVLPTLGNQVVSVVLGSAQASIIGVAELTYETQSVGSATFRYFELFTIAALFYIACSQVIGAVWRLLTGRAAKTPLGT